VQKRRDAAIGLVDVAASDLTRPTRTALAERIRTDPDPDVRQFAIEALGIAGHHHASLEAGLSDEEEWVRAEAVVAHSRTRPDDVGTIRDRLEDDSGWVRRNAVIALGKTGEATQSELIDRIKTDPHPPVREYAAQFLSASPDDPAEAVRILAAVLAREPNAFVRAKAAESLGELATDRAEEALETQGLNDRSENVQRTAKLALAAARGEDPETIDLPEQAPPGGGPEQPVDGPGPPPGAEGATWEAHRSAKPDQPGPDAGTHGHGDGHRRQGGDRR
jgi:HEAT repeat protein